MNIKVISIKKFVLYLTVVYIFNKLLIDQVTFGFFKIIYYMFIAIGGIRGILFSVSHRKELRRATIFYLLYVAIVLVNGIALSNADQRSIGYIEYITYPLVFFSLLFYMNGNMGHESLFKMISYWGPITSALALIEYITKTPISSLGSTRIYVYYNGVSAYRAGVFCGSPMDLAVLLAVSLLVSLYYFRQSHKTKYVVYIIADFVGIFCTGSRGPLCCALIAILFMYIQYYKNKKIYASTITYMSIASVIVVLIIGLYSFFPGFFVGNEFIDNSISRFSSSFNFSSEWGNMERINRWVYYLDQFTSNALFGIGVGSTSAEVLSNAFVTAHGVTTESGILARLVETGIVGVIPYYCFLFSIINIGIKSAKKRYPLQLDDKYYFIIGIIVLSLLEDIILQISLDILCVFAMCLALAELVYIDICRTNKERGT